jgi:2-polyprenyl-3-methyl-5-hydroxy-6-metoxy-1,4-benzoquinol methylase
VDDAVTEIRQGERFAFGENWRRYLDALNPAMIDEAVTALRDTLGVDTLDGLTFLDAGSGSGIHSLAAYRLGAEVVSFDFDPESVACTRHLRDSAADEGRGWKVEHGSVLDAEFLERLGRFDVVYSWGVLHHTGAMWQSLAAVADRVVPGGRLFISIYNDMGGSTRRWTTVKRLYNEHPRWRPAVTALSAVRLWGPTMVLDAVRGRPMHSWRSHGENRGMTPWRDLIDWVGGWPFEAAKPEEIFDFYRDQGFALERLVTRMGHGCNEFVFVRSI